MDELHTLIGAGGAEGALDQVYKDTLTATERIDLAWQNINLGLAEAFAPMMEAFADAMDKWIIPALKVFSEHADVAVPLLGGLATGFAALKIGKGVVGSIKGIATAVKGIAGKAVAAGTGLFTVAAGERAAGTAGTLSAKNIMATAAAVLALGGAIALISVGIKFMADAAIEVAAAGPEAIAVFFGMVGAGFLLAVGLSAIGRAATMALPGLLGLSVAVLAIGGAIALASWGLSMFAPYIETIAEFGLQAALGILAMGGALIVFGLGAVAAGAALLLASAGFLAFNLALGDVPQRVAMLGDGMTKTVSALNGMTDAAQAGMAGLMILGAGCTMAAAAASTMAQSIEGSMNRLKQAVATGADGAYMVLVSKLLMMQQAVASCELRLPDIQVGRIPRFTISGSFDAKTGSVPVIGVDWFARGAVFAPNSPGIIGVGDAREPEILAPASQLGDYIGGRGGDINVYVTVQGRDGDDYDLIGRRVGDNAARRIKQAMG